MNTTEHPYAYRVLVTAILGFLALPGCEKPEKSGTAPAQSPDPHRDQQSEYSTSEMVITPVDRTIIDQHGRSLDVQIIARSGTHARMVRLSDGMKFDLPFRDLSEDDQRFIIRIPETPYMGPLETRSANTGKKVSETPSYIKNREESIALLEIKLEEQMIEFSTHTAEKGRGKATARMRMMLKEIDRTSAEIKRLEGQIEVYRNKNQN